jgi:lipopolysaccharide biosynthesis protein
LSELEAAARAIAFYLPQFHPIPENDEWWGAGFTEWTNTARARPLFPGHRQPDLPADLGFYDLRVPEARLAQAELASRYGIAAFCYWHYWFGAGRRILELPFSEVLRTGQPALPFCLAWANQSWTGIWHGAPHHVLMQQTYPGPEDDQAHFDAIVGAFRDERYLRVGDRPLFYVFRPEELPDAAAFVDRWQAMARRAGLPGLYLVAEVSDLLGHGPTYLTVREDGFDAGAYMRMPMDFTRSSVLGMRIRRKIFRGPEVYRYSAGPVALPAGVDPVIHQPAVYPNWDNTPRSRRNGLVLNGAEPERFRPHLRAAIDQVRDRTVDERIVWIKSWNEWAEGNHLEPDVRFGHGWLDVVREELFRGR